MAEGIQEVTQVAEEGEPAGATRPMPDAKGREAQPVVRPKVWEAQPAALVSEPQDAGAPDPGTAQCSPIRKLATHTHQVLQDL